MFRRLGFKSDDIYMALYANGIFMTLKTQGKEFTISCGPYPEGVDGHKLEELWKDAAVKWNKTMTNIEKQALMNDSKLMQMGIGNMVLALQNKGVRIPELNKNVN